jgi:xylulokinase
MPGTRDLVLSIDIGTTGLKLGMYDAKGSCLFFRRTDTPVKELDLQTIDVVQVYDAVLAGIREMVDHSGLGERVEVIGIDGQMGGMVGVDDTWQPVIPFDPPINNNFKSHLTRALGKFGEVVVRETGSIPINGAKIVYWMKEQPGIFRKVRKVVSLGGFIIGKLIGLKSDQAFIDRTTLYLFGLAGGDGWSEKVCTLLEIPIAVLPQIRASTDIVGRLGREASAACGLRAGIPLIAGVGDTASSILGAGVINEGDAVDIAGTCSVLGFCIGRPVSDPGNMTLLRLEAPLPDTWYMVGIGFGGEIYRWFMDNVYLCGSIGRAHDELDKTAQEIPAGSEELLFLPFLGGTFTPPNDRVKGMWCGLHWKHSVCHMYRSILESIAYEYSYYYGIYQDISASPPCRSVTVTGSGKKNELWNQIKADVLGCDFLSLRRDDQENLGTALVAARAVNLTTDIRRSLQNCLEVERCFSPAACGAGMYKRMLRRYVRCRRDAMKGIDHAERHKGAGVGL